MNCSCGGEMTYYRGITEDGDYFECDKCGTRVYVNEKQW